MRKIETYVVNSGKALVINMKTFQQDARDKKTRYGSENDVETLKYVLGKLHFVVTVKLDRTKEEVVEDVEQFVAELSEAPVDISFVCIMSHGDKDILISHDNIEINLEKDILEKFSNSKCPQMREKPKIFLIQSCRGKNRETMRDDAHPIQAHAIDTSTLRDAIIAYSTVPGFVANRQDDGTWFIKAFCTVFEQPIHTIEVQQLFKHVSLELSDMQFEKEKQTMEVTYRCFEKDLFFKTTNSQDASIFLQDSSQQALMPDSFQRDTASNHWMASIFCCLCECLIKCWEWLENSTHNEPGTNVEEPLLVKDSQPNGFNNWLPLDSLWTKEKIKDDAQKNYKFACSRFDQDGTEDNKAELQKAWDTLKKAWEDLLERKIEVDLSIDKIRQEEFIDLDFEHKQKMKTNRVRV